MSRNQNRILSFCILMLFLVPSFLALSQVAENSVQGVTLKSHQELSRIKGSIQYTQIQKPTQKNLVAMTNSESVVVITLDDLAEFKYRDGVRFSYSVLSPAKDKIGFTVQGGAVDLLGVVDLGTGSCRKLMELPGGAIEGPVWSPDALWLAVTLKLPSGLEEVDIIDTRTATRPIFQTITREFHSKEIETKVPQWSADGTRLLFLARHAGDSTETKWAISLDGHKIDRLD